MGEDIASKMTAHHRRIAETTDMLALTKAGLSDTGVSPSGSGLGYIFSVRFMAGQTHSQQENVRY